MTIVCLFNGLIHLDSAVQKEAVLYERLANHKVRCLACACYCELGPDQSDCVALGGIRKANFSYDMKKIPRIFYRWNKTVDWKKN